MLGRREEADLPKMSGSQLPTRYAGANLDDYALAGPHMIFHNPVAAIRHLMR